MRNLEDVLKDLKEAEKEYKEKCLKYGIEESHKRRSNTLNETAVPDEIDNGDKD